MSNQTKMFTKPVKENNSIQDQSEGGYLDNKKKVKDLVLKMADESLNDDEYSTKRSKSRKRTDLPLSSNSALSKKRPKTASREASLTKNPPSRQKLNGQLDAVKNPGIQLKLNLTKQSAAGVDQSFRKSGGAFA